MTNNERRAPWFLWPFYALWRLVTLVLSATGRVVCGAVGIALVVAGTVATLTIVGAPLGVALIALGVLLLIRAVF